VSREGDKVIATDTFSDSVRRSMRKRNPFLRGPSGRRGKRPAPNPFAEDLDEDKSNAYTNGALDEAGRQNGQVESEGEEEADDDDEEGLDLPEWLSELPEDLEVKDHNSSKHLLTMTVRSTWPSGNLRRL